jgi:hypothetical protein
MVCANKNHRIMVEPTDYKAKEPQYAMVKKQLKCVVSST